MASEPLPTLPPPAMATPGRASLDDELRYGPGLRVQRLVEAGFLLLALFTQDLRFAYVTFVFTTLQALSPRWLPVAIVVARLVRFSGRHRIGDLYFDLRGSRGAAAISWFVQAGGIGLAHAGWPTAGLLVLTVPAASFLMAPTLGFCAGCWFYVLGRDWLARHGLLRRGFDEQRDLAIGADQPELRAPAQR